MGGNKWKKTNKFNHPADTNGDGKVSDEDTICIWNSREKNLMTKMQ